MKVTTAEYFVRDIRSGDKVTDKHGRVYIAQTDAELDQMGEYNVLTNEGKYVAYSTTDIVTVEYTEELEYSY